MEASPLPHKARGSKTTPGSLLLLLLPRPSLEAACYATLPGYGGRGTGRISALASFGGAGQTVMLHGALGCMAWLTGKRDSKTNTCTGTSASTRLVAFMSSAVACSCAPRGVRASRYKYRHLHEQRCLTVRGRRYVGSMLADDELRRW